MRGADALVGRGRGGAGAPGPGAARAARAHHADARRGGEAKRAETTGERRAYKAFRGNTEKLALVLCALWLILEVSFCTQHKTAHMRDKKHSRASTN